MGVIPAQVRLVDRDTSKPIFKAGRQSDAEPFDFVLSDESIDRMGDRIRADGWALDSFRANPVALFGHDHASIIGKWENVRVEGKKLLGRLHMAKAGTSELVDTVRSLIEQRILKAVSVGFQPIEAEPMKGGGYDFIKSTLHECSIVAVPANPNALAVAMVKATKPHLVKQLFVQPDSRAYQLAGQSTHHLKTPNLDAARKRFKSMGID